MPLPSAREARPFYQSSLQRFDDATLLMENNRTTGAVYLAGYGVECILKALIMASISADRRAAMLAMFRGTKAHDFDWLRARYRESGTPGLPAAISKSFALVSWWETELRYQPGAVRVKDALRFLRAADEIIKWADGRL